MTRSERLLPGYTEESRKFLEPYLPIYTPEDIAYIEKQQARLDEPSRELVVYQGGYKPLEVEDIHEKFGIKINEDKEFGINNVCDKNRLFTLEYGLMSISVLTLQNHTNLAVDRRDDFDLSSSAILDTACNIVPNLLFPEKKLPGKDELIYNTTAQIFKKNTQSEPEQFLLQEETTIEKFKGRMNNPESIKRIQLFVTPEPSLVDFSYWLIVDSPIRGNETIPALSIQTHYKQRTNDETVEWMFRQARGGVRNSNIIPEFRQAINTVVDRAKKVDK